MQDNINYVNRPEELEARRALERPVVEEAMQWCQTQHAAGHFYLLENPLTSRLWQEESVQAMLSDTKAFFVTCHSGASGAKNTKGQMIKKTFQFASNNRDILHYLSDKLTAEELKQCVPLEGKDLTQSHEYPQPGCEICGQVAQSHSLQHQEGLCILLPARHRPREVARRDRPC